MISFEEMDKFTKEVLLPAVSMDGGDIRLESVEGDSVVFGAYAECAVCIACNDNYIWWLSGRLRDHFGLNFDVRIEKHPYYFGS